jgi:hypothetical protein
LDAGLYLVTPNTKDVVHMGALVFNPRVDNAADFPLTPPPSRGA